MRTFKQVEGALEAANNRDQLTAYYKFLRYDEELRSTTIFNNISMLRDYYNKYESISKENLLEYLATKNTKVDYYVIIRKFARFLLEIKQLDELLLKEIESIKIKQKKIPNYTIDPEKIKKWAVPQDRWSEVFVQANTNPQKMVYFMGLQFGLRRGELTHLSIKDFQLQDQPYFLQVRPRDDEPYDPWEPKTVNSIRRLPISSKQREIIANYLKKREQFLKTYFPQIKHNYVFYSARSGKNIKEDRIEKWFKNVKLEYTENGKTFTRLMRPHVARYSAAWYQWEKSKNLYAVSKFLGHSSMKQTEEYLGLTEQQIFDVLVELNKIAGL